MMLDDGDYIVIGKLIPGGEAAGKGYSKMLCVVYVCDDRNIHTRAHTYIHVHREDRGREGRRERERKSYGRDIRTHARGQHTCSCK